MDEYDYNLRDVKLTLYISKVISIDKTYNMLEVKRIANELFAPYNLSNQYSYFIAENEITNFEKVNVLRSLNLYKTSEIIIKIKNFNDEYKDYYEGVMEDFQTAKERFVEKYEIPVQDTNPHNMTKVKNKRNKESVTHAYKNLECIRKKLGELQTTKEEFHNATDLINKSEQIIQNSKKILQTYNINISNKSNNQNNSELINITAENNKLYNSKDEKSINSRSLNKIFSETNMLLNSQHNKSRTDNSKRGVPEQKVNTLKESNYNNYNVDPLSSNYHYLTNKDYMDYNNMTYTSFHSNNQHSSLPKQLTVQTPLRAQNLNRNVNERTPSSKSLALSGKMVNPNIEKESRNTGIKADRFKEIWKLINILENELKSEGNIDVHNMSKTIEIMTNQINIVYEKNIELTSIKDQLKRTLKNAQETIHNLKREIENLKKSYMLLEKKYEESKENKNQNLNNIKDEIVKNFEFQIIIKDKEIAKLIKEKENLKELIEKSKKNIKDYEDYTNELNRTIDILKRRIQEKEEKVCDNCCDLADKLEILRRSLDEYTSKYDQYCIESENEKQNLMNEIEKLKDNYQILVNENQKLFLKIQEINSNIKIPQPYLTFSDNKDDQLNKDINCSLDFEVYNLNARVKNLNILLGEKDRIIDSLKTTNCSLNEILEKNKEKEISHENINQYKDEIEKLIKTKENFIKENNELKDKINKINSICKTEQDKFKESNDNLKKENEELKQKLNILTLRKSKELELLEKEINELYQEKNNCTKDELNKKDQVIKNLNDKINELNEELEKMKKDLESNEKEINKLNNEILALNFKFNDVNYTPFNKNKNKENNLPYNPVNLKKELAWKMPLNNNHDISVDQMLSGDSINYEEKLPNDHEEEERNEDMKNSSKLKEDIGTNNNDNNENFNFLKVSNENQIEILSSYDLKKDLEKLNTENKSLKDKNDEFKNRIDNLLKEMKISSGLEEQYKNKLDNLNEQNIKLQKDYNEIKKNNDRLKDEIENMIKSNNLSKIPKNHISSANQSIINEEVSSSNNSSLIDSMNNLSNMKLSVKKSVTIKEGTTFLFTVFDSKRILKFDIEYRTFKLFEFADYGDFHQNYNPPGSLYLNILDGLIIISGENIDIFYLYNYKKNSMNRISKLRDNHSYGGLVYYEEDNSLLCCSGWHNKRVERYINSDITFNFLLKKQELLQVKGNKTWTQLPEMNMERSECPFIILNKQHLYAFFGFNCPQMKYLDSIERLDLSKSDASWEFIKYCTCNEKNISAFRKSHSCVKLNETEVLFVGGFDGQNDVAIENFSFFNSEKCVFSQNERKFPEIMFNHIYSFQKHSFFVPFIDIKSKLHYASIDEKENVHVVEVSSLQYDIFKFED